MNKDFFEFLNSLNDKDYMNNFITYLISPIITGIKPSSTITLTKEGKNLYDLWEKYGDNFLEELNLKSIVLRKESNAKIILVYNELNLMNTLYSRDIFYFLEKLGYNMNMTISKILNHLVYRYSTFHCPHELGIFLGIPLIDVKNFMDCSKKKCILCGYWKVYENKEVAERIFKFYDSSKEITMLHLLQGKNLDELHSLMNDIYKNAA